MAADSSSMNSPNVGAIACLVFVVMAVPARGSDRFAQASMARYPLHMMDHPTRPAPQSGKTFPTGLKELWLQAMGRPDPEFRRMLVDSITVAHRRGMPDTDKVHGRLLSLLRDPDPNLEVVRAVASAMVAMDADEYAGRLVSMVKQHGPTIGDIVEPALVRWKSPAMKDIWLKRVRDAGEGETAMILAIQGLGVLDEPDNDRAAAAMKAIVRSNSQPAAVRIAAAQAIGNLGILKLPKLIDEVLAMDSQPRELSAIMAMELIAGRTDQRMVAMLTSLLNEPSTAVQSRALKQLFQINPDLVDRQADRLIKSTDTNVRTWAVRGMIANQSWERMDVLSRVLSDANPSLRREVADALGKLAESHDLRPHVIESTMKVLQEDDWRGCEQAAVVLAKLGHASAGQRLVTLLEHPRGEVKVAAAWSLKELQGAEQLPSMLEQAQRLYDRFSSRHMGDAMPGASLCIAHLFETFGEQRYQPSAPLMEKCLAKNSKLGEEARAAAAWAFGLLLQNQPDNEVAPLLLGRLTDSDFVEPESEMVREMCAISLGWMQAEIAIGALRKQLDLTSRTGFASYWAIEQLTGRKPPEIEPPTAKYDDWILTPLKKRR